MYWFIHWLEDFIYSVNTLYEWLTLPLVDLGGFSLTPIMLISVGGLTAYLGIAITKWLIS